MTARLLFHGNQIVDGANSDINTIQIHHLRTLPELIKKDRMSYKNIHRQTACSG